MIKKCPRSCWAICAVAFGVALLPGCGLYGHQDINLPIVLKPLPPRPSLPSPVLLTDVTAAAGLKFRHNNGAFGLKLYPETMGSGAAFIDYDGDGYPDIFFVNGRDWTPAEINAYKNGPGRLYQQQYGAVIPPPKSYHRTTCALYHNNRNGTFTDVTKGSGLDIEIQGMGVAVGDYDNDGRPDLYVTGYGRNYLFHNEGGGKFKEVAQQAGVQDSGFSTSAAWVDYDRDGKLDLFVCRYVNWQPANDIWAFGSPTKIHGGYVKSYAVPAPFDGQASHLYRNLGHGRFVDVSRQAGIYAPMAALNLNGSSAVDAQAAKASFAKSSAAKTTGQMMALGAAPRKRQGKSLGVAICDFNNDGWPDILVANDEVRNYLYRNNRNGTFTEVGVPVGVAYSAHGRARAGMGVDTGDADHAGRDNIVIGNFSNEGIGLYQDQGNGLFKENAGLAGLVGSSRFSVTFGCVFVDINNDGWLDILAANGHVQDTIEVMARGQTYAERPLLYINRRENPVKFDEVGLQSGAAMRQPIVGRGLACADIDLDGRLDVLITTNGSAPELLHNEPAPGTPRYNALRLTLVGRQSNRSAIGARVAAVVTTPVPMTIHRMVKSGSSYLSQSELPLTLGLGHATTVENLTIDWPSGRHTQLRRIAANQALTVDEDAGIVQRQLLTHR